MEATIEDPVIGGEQPIATANEQPRPAAGLDLARLKAALAATVPGMDASLIDGDSLEAVAASFAALRDATWPKPTPPAIPAGAPGRRQLQPATPFEKIREGLTRLGS
jgi:hypothetical protein